MRSRQTNLLVLSGILILSLLAGCTSIQTTDPVPTGTLPLKTTQPVQALTSTPSITATIAPVTYLQVDPNKLHGLVIEFIHPWAGEAANQVNQAIADFNEQNLWGIRVETVAAGSRGALGSTVSAALDTGDLPNLVVASPDQVTAWQLDSNIFVDLNDYIHNREWGYNADERDDFDPYYWKLNEMDGIQVGIPAEEYLHGLFYNNTWAIEMGFNQPPKTPDEFREQACAAAQANQVLSEKNIAYSGTGGWLVNYDALDSWSWLAAFGADPVLDNGDFRFESKPAAQAFQYLREIYDDGCAWIGREPQPYKYFSSRQALFFSGSMLDILQTDFSQSHTNSHDKWTIIPYPSGTGEPVTVLSVLSYGILSASDEEQLASWLLLRWLTRPDYQAEFVRVSGSLPLSTSALNSLGEFEVFYPQWSNSLTLMKDAIPAPNQAKWRVARRLLEDFAWQLYQANITADQVPDLLIEMDRMLGELSE